MNERIRELCIKAGAAPLPGSTGLFINALNPEKFAQLIIEECANNVQDLVDRRLPASEYPTRLKKHFEVE